MQSISDDDTKSLTVRVEKELERVDKERVDKEITERESWKKEAEEAPWTEGLIK